MGDNQTRPRNMNKRYQVFVSSTYEDLKQERNKVITALLSMGHIPCGMEYFPASDEDAWQCIERLIPQCDYYVLLLGGKYGTVPSGSSSSYTQREYELAVASGVPVLSLLHGKPDELPKKLCESDPKVQAKLDRFRAKAGKRLCRFWKTADQIPGELLASLAHQIDRFPRTGWVRADSLASEDAKSELLNLRKKLDRSEALVKKFEKAKSDQESELSSGGDELRLCGTIRNYERHRRAAKADQRVFCQARVELVSTWDKLLRFFSDHLDRGVQFSSIQHLIKEEISRRSKENPKILKSGDWEDLCVDINDGEIDKIVNQLFSLNLIVQGKSYPYEWKKTPKGSLQAGRLRALRKGELHPGGEDWCELLLGAIEKVKKPAVTNVFEEW